MVEVTAAGLVGGRMRKQKAREAKTWLLIYVGTENGPGASRACYVSYQLHVIRAYVTPLKACVTRRYAVDQLQRPKRSVLRRVFGADRARSGAVTSPHWPLLTSSFRTWASCLTALKRRPPRRYPSAETHTPRSLQSTPASLPALLTTYPPNAPQHFVIRSPRRPSLHAPTHGRITRPQRENTCKLLLLCPHRELHSATWQSVSSPPPKSNIR